MIIKLFDEHKWLTNIDHPIAKTFSEIWNNGTMDHRCSDDNCIGKIYENLAYVDKPLLKNIFANYGNITINNYITYGDSPHEDIDLCFDYDDIFEDKELNKLMIDSLNGTHYDIAAVLYYLYKDKFVLCGEKSWYKFEGHRWIDHDDLELRKNISNDLCKKYMTILKFYKKKNENIQKIKKLNDLVLSLKKHNLKIIL